MQLGLELALMGMGTVFSFLVLLIFITGLMSKLISSYEKKIIASAPVKTSINKKTDTISDELLTGIISNAIQQHRANISKKV